MGSVALVKGASVSVSYALNQCRLNSTGVEKTNSSNSDIAVSLAFGSTKTCLLDLYQQSNMPCLAHTIKLTSTKFSRARVKRKVRCSFAEIQNGTYLHSCCLIRTVSA
jgi:hypothetical protein